MRKLAVVACVAFLGTSGSALAADCGKGMLWPFVRTAGDCLTDVEIAAGQSGVYSGPVNTNVDVSAIKPTDVPAQSTSVSSGLLGGTSTSGNGALIPLSVFGGEAAGRVAACNKGWFWPFSRSPGDCLTEEEKREGRTGVYGGGPAGAQPNAPVIAQPAGATPTVAAASNAQTPASPAAVSCSKGWFWPFVRESNDCPTAAERGNGRAAVSSAAPVAAPVSAPAAAISSPGVSSVQAIAQPAAAPSTAAVTCEKGWFWPFVRESNDCQSAAEKAAGRTSPTVTQVSATMAAAPATAAPAMAASSNSAQAPTAQPISAPSTAATGCQKGWLWPFVREAGDCATEQEKKNAREK